MEAGVSACSLHNWQAGRRNAVAGIPQSGVPKICTSQQRSGQVRPARCYAQSDAMLRQCLRQSVSQCGKLSGGGAKGVRSPLDTPSALAAFLDDARDTALPMATSQLCAARPAA